MAHISKNKIIKRIQKRINKIVKPTIRDIHKCLNYDTLKLPWISDLRPNKFWKNNMKMTKVEHEFYHNRIKQLKELGHITEVKDLSTIKNIIPIFAISKKGGSSKNDNMRDIMDFSYLNCFIKNISANLPTYNELQIL